MTWPVWQGVWQCVASSRVARWTKILPEWLITRNTAAAGLRRWATTSSHCILSNCIPRKSRAMAFQKKGTSLSKWAIPGCFYLITSPLTITISLPRVLTLNSGSGAADDSSTILGPWTLLDHSCACCFVCVTQSRQTCWIWGDLISLVCVDLHSHFLCCLLISFPNLSLKFATTSLYVRGCMAWDRTVTSSPALGTKTPGRLWVGHSLSSKKEVNDFYFWKSCPENCIPRKLLRQTSSIHTHIHTYKYTYTHKVNLMP